LLGKALTHDVKNESAIRELLVLSDPDAEFGIQAEQVLSDPGTSGQSQFTAQLILGCRAAAKHQSTLAAEHFRLATDEFENTPAILSNTAWLMITLEEESENRDQLALLFCNQSIDLVNHRSPILPFLLETRGRLLGQMQRWPQAIADLHEVLEHKSDQRHVHSLLATAYDAVGDKVRADQHRQLCGLQ
jgi:hypothetical protein